MKFIECAIDQPEAYIIPIGDVHFGDKAFSKEGKKKLLGYLNWGRERKNVRFFLNGDIFNVAGRNSKTSPFETNTSEYQDAIEFFKPYADLIVGAVDGNHEARLFDEYGFSPLGIFCSSLKIPYCGWSSVVKFKVGKRNTFGYRQNYYFYFHHTTGGGGTIGGKLNRVTKLRDIVEGIDVYVGSHNHQLASAPQDVFYPTNYGIQKRRIWYVDAGSYLEWQDSYAEKGMMAPTKLGSPRIRLSGKVDDRDIHISI